MCETSKTPHASRTARCSSRIPPYCTGISQPGEGHELRARVDVAIEQRRALERLGRGGGGHRARTLPTRRRPRRVASRAPRRRARRPLGSDHQVAAICRETGSGKMSSWPAAEPVEDALGDDGRGGLGNVDPSQHVGVDGASDGEASWLRAPALTRPSRAPSPCCTIARRRPGRSRPLAERGPRLAGDPRPALHGARRRARRWPTSPSWRMDLAARRLARDGRTGGRGGRERRLYVRNHAFSRAFSRVRGEPPGRYRRAQAA